MERSFPLVGLGTWELYDEQCFEVVRMALDLGYRHIDTAGMYNNSHAIGKAIKNFPREKLFLTSKFMTGELKSRSLEELCDRALLELGTDYLDSYLLHYPDRTAPMDAILGDLERLKEKGKVRLPGVSNCTIRHLKDFIGFGFVPAANQVEFHPELYQKDLLEFCSSHGITLISYRSFGKGAMLGENLYADMARKYNKTPAQLLLRFCVQQGIPVIPKSTSKKHLQENLEIFDFAISDDDMKTLSHLPHQKRYCQRDEWSDFDYL